MFYFLTSFPDLTLNPRGAHFYNNNLFLLLHPPEKIMFAQKGNKVDPLSLHSSLCTEANYVYDG